MVTYECSRCHQTFAQKGHLTRHEARKNPCKPVPISDSGATTTIAKLEQQVQTLQQQLNTLVSTPSSPITAEAQQLKCIDLFCGIGGFHQALASLGVKCVLACDIDAACRDIYKKNYGLEPHPDITTLKEDDIPDFDILCGGFPCQAFSHAGKQGGFEDTRGTLFRDVCRILREKQPKYFLLENVKNLRGHDGGKTWIVIYNSLTESGYYTYTAPIVLSPHTLGVPQHRERVFLLGVRKDLVEGKTIQEFPAVTPVRSSIQSILLPDDKVPKGFQISDAETEAITLWEEVVQHFKTCTTKLPGFPLWSDDWDSTYDLKPLPKWKAKFVEQNRTFYTKHKTFLEPWLLKARTVNGFSGSKRKLEWQCGNFTDEDSLWKCLLQIRPSGIRVKRPTYSPALVAMAQIAIVGEKRRRLCPREVARLQSFPDSFQLPSSTSVAYKQFGNSVNVKVITHMAKWLLEKMVA
jgi:DNA (cytosine-5)-methyltransferase 1